MRRDRFPMNRRGQRGIALFIGLTFLIVLSVVAVIAMRGTLTEMHMVNNVAVHEQLFEVSESLRDVTVSLFDDHTFNRGWPSTMTGGTQPQANYSTYPICGVKPIGSNGVSCDMLKAVSIRQDAATGAVNLYQIPYQTGELAYDPGTWVKNSKPDVTITSCASGTCTSGGTTSIWVRPDGTGLLAGSSAGQEMGYPGLGAGTTGGSAALFFEILSVASTGGTGPTDAAATKAMTLTQYKQRIAN
ncbi:pilus assembly PilX family protein [Dyella sp.]|uniref:pilus assembly PilX family protein n=1 Tax=Dyella sp. TaxID=1869338 RepID=UPI002ED1C19C